MAHNLNLVTASRSGFKTSDQVQGSRSIERGDGVLKPLLRGIGCLKVRVEKNRVGTD